MLVQRVDKLRLGGIDLVAAHVVVDDVRLIDDRRGGEVVLSGQRVLNERAALAVGDQSQDLVGLGSEAVRAQERVVVFRKVGANQAEVRDVHIAPVTHVGGLGVPGDVDRVEQRTVDVALGHAALEHDVVAGGHLRGEQRVRRQQVEDGHLVLVDVALADIPLDDLLAGFHDAVVLHEVIEPVVDDGDDEIAVLIEELGAVGHGVLDGDEQHLGQCLQILVLEGVGRELRVLQLLVEDTGHLEEDLDGPGEGAVAVLGEAHDAVLVGGGLEDRGETDIGLVAHEVMDGLLRGGLHEHPVGLEQLVRLLLIDRDLLALQIDVDESIVECVQLVPGEALGADEIHRVREGVLAERKRGLHDLQSLVAVDEHELRTGQLVAAEIGGGETEAGLFAAEEHAGHGEVDRGDLGVKNGIMELGGAEILLIADVVHVLVFDGHDGFAGGRAPELPARIADMTDFQRVGAVRHVRRAVDRVEVAVRVHVFDQPRPEILKPAHDDRKPFGKAACLKRERGQERGFRNGVFRQRILIALGAHEHHFHLGQLCVCQEVLRLGLDLVTHVENRDARLPGNIGNQLAVDHHGDFAVALRGILDGVKRCFGVFCKDGHGQQAEHHGENKQKADQFFVHGSLPFSEK